MINFVFFKKMSSTVFALIIYNTFYLKGQDKEYLLCIFVCDISIIIVFFLIIYSLLFM